MQSSLLDGPDDKTFDEACDYMFRSNEHQLCFFGAESFVKHDLDDVIQSFVSCNKITTNANKSEYGSMQPLFNWMPLDVIKKTMQPSTQHDSAPASYLMKKTHLSPFHDLNIKRRSEPVATCTIYCDAPSIDNGSKCDRFFMFTKTLVSDFYGMNSDKQLVNILGDNIRQRVSLIN